MSVEKKDPRGRVFMLALECVYHDAEVTEDTIKVGLSHKPVEQFAYILHDKDVVSASDVSDKNINLGHEYDDMIELIGKAKEKGIATSSIDVSRDEYIKEHNDLKVGEPKPKHWQVVLSCPSAPKVSAVARWFGCPSYMVQILKGRGAFLDGVEYLTHETEVQQALGKHLYSDSEVVASFDFRAELLARDADAKRYGKGVSKLDKWLLDVMRGDLSPEECKHEDELLYIQNRQKLIEAQKEYVNSQRNPHLRINILISSAHSNLGGVGKTQFARALADALYPGRSTDRVYCMVGQEHVAFEGYKGQPVVIYDDFRAQELLDTLGGRGKVFDLFDPFPAEISPAVNIKYGSLHLCNEINIITTSEPYEKFISDLAGTEDDVQVTRRLPLIIPFSEEAILYLVNSGYWSDPDSHDYRQFIAYRNIKGNFAKLLEVSKKNPELLEVGEPRFIDPGVKAIHQIEAKYSTSDMTAQEKLDALDQILQMGDMSQPVSPKAMELRQKYIDQIASESEDSESSDGGDDFEECSNSL